MLTDDQRRFFWSNGYLPVGRVASPRQVEALRNEFETLMDPAGPRVSEDHVMRSEADAHIRVGLHLCHLSELFRAQSCDSAVMHMVGALLGEEPAVLTSLVFNKPPQVGEGLLPHQDLAYYPYLGKDDLITCWTALDDVNQDNGAVEYLPGSHRALIEHRRTGLQQALAIDAAALDMDGAVSVPLKAGEMVAHHGLTAHRSAPNVSTRPRAGVATLYVRASIKISTDDFPYPVLVRGGEARA